MKIYQLFLAILFMMLVAGTFAQQEEVSPSFLQTAESVQNTEAVAMTEDEEEDEEWATTSHTAKSA